MSAIKHYKHILLAAALMFAAAGQICAQAYTNSPGDSIVSNADLDDVSVFTITQLHPGNDTLHFKYLKYSVSMPASWDALLCDNAACHPDLKDSSQMTAVPGDNGLMSLHLNPHFEAGTGIIRYLLYDVNMPAQTDTLTWIISAGAAVLSLPPVQEPLISLHQQTLMIKNPDPRFEKLRIVDTEGKTIYFSSINKNERYTIPSCRSLIIVYLSGKNISWHQKISPNN